MSRPVMIPDNVQTQIRIAGPTYRRLRRIALQEQRSIAGTVRLLMEEGLRQRMTADLSARKRTVRR